jgi:hypothetical protein
VRTVLVGCLAGLFGMAPLELGSSGGTASAQPSSSDVGDVDAAFRALVSEGLREYDTGNWSEARALFQRAYELVPSAEALRMMGNASYELRQYARAVELLERALSETARPLRPERAVEANDALERARRFVVVVTLELVPANLQLEIDLSPIAPRPDGTILMDPGTHRFIARAPGFQTRELDVELRAGDRHRFVVALESEASTWDARPSNGPTVDPSDNGEVAPIPRSLGVAPAPAPAPRLDLAPFLAARTEARRARLSLRASRVGLVMSAALLAVGGVVLGVSGRTDGLSPTFLGGDCRYQCRWSGGSVLGLTLTVAGGLGSVGGLIAWLMRRRSAQRAEDRARELELDVRREADALGSPVVAQGDP